MEIRFYMLSKTSTTRGLARLVEKVVSLGKTVGIAGRDDDHIKSISDGLWSEVEFLPHSIDGSDDVAPVDVSAKNPRGGITIVADDAAVPETGTREMLCYMFNAVDQDIVAARRADWKRLRDEGVKMSYWSEDINGSWVKSASENDG